MINSSRKFGVEIEFSTMSHTMLHKLSQKLPITRDGSLRGIDNAAEYVSPVLSGKSGEKKLRYHCDVLKSHGAASEDVRMGLHIHLDANMSVGNSWHKVRPKEARCMGVSNKVKRLFDSLPEDVYKILESHSSGYVELGHGLNIYVTDIDNVRYLTMGQITKHPLANFTYRVKQENDRFNWLRNMMYFYTQYSDVMENLVSNSRKFGNMYCIPLGKSFDLEEIARSTTIDELRNVWYKGRPSDRHYDNSRYHNVNFHSVWNKTGTVEFRSHGGTIDCNKILLWVRLHQTIADKLETMELKDITASGELHQSFVNFLDDELTRSYVKRLLGYFSNIKVK